MQKLISIVIPVYNTLAYLEEAINSVLIQSDFIKDIIIINDGSTDKSGELLGKKYGKNQLVEILHTENFGQGHARNIGIEKAKGEFIYCFDSDDILVPGLFENFYSHLEKEKEIELFCFSGDSFLDKNFDKKLVKNQSLFKEDTYKRKTTTLLPSGEEAFNFLIKNRAFFPGPPFYIFKKSICIKNNIQFEEIRYEDEEFTTKLFLNSGKTFITKDVFFRRRVRVGSTMQIRRNFKDIEGYLRNIESLEILISKSNLLEETKSLLLTRIHNFLKLIIIIKVVDKIKLSKFQKKILDKSIKPYLCTNNDLRIFYYRYPIEHQIRNIKSKFLDFIKFISK
ncbi:MAG: glycosyltransferase family 2 protein [Ignavibacteriae bacterium]|nr:glycosyltransferase family 2 protein [Ignavibacteriota bacterium]MCB9207962.1 glycosyltransferase family 2 protein [Ignavibacteriales bacterium]MCB9258731.1 glycosyltransferase family 2 protein [Ignavibacteriales bacterium]